MTASKLIKIFGARAKIETTYNVSAAPANADAILLAKNPTLKEGWANDGARALPPGTMGNQLRVAPSGRTGEISLDFEPRGAGAPYSATVLPNVNVPLRCCGLDAVVTTTAGVESVAYTPSTLSSGFASATADLFSRGQQYTLTGIYGDLTLGAAGPVVPTLTTALKGLLASVGDASVPALVYGTLGTILPPKAVNIGFTINSISTLKLKSWTLKFNRALGARLDQNAGGHAGWSVGSRNPTFEFSVENPANSLIDFHAMRAAATQFALSLTIGSVQYNKFGLTTPATAQVIDVSDADEDPTALVTIVVQLNPSALGANDEFTLTFN